MAVLLLWVVMVAPKVVVGVLVVSQARQVEVVVKDDVRRSAVLRLSFAGDRLQAVMDQLDSGWIVH
jgi:hypothetical protein